MKFSGDRAIARTEFLRRERHRKKAENENAFNKCYQNLSKKWSQKYRDSEYVESFCFHIWNEAIKRTLKAKDKKRGKK